MKTGRRQPIGKSRWADVHQAVWRALQRAKGKIYLCAHVGIDGDGLGAMMGLWHLLGARGIGSAMVLDSPVPQAYAFLPGSDEILSPEAVEPGPGSVCVALDSASLPRMGDGAQVAEAAGTVINIDHHVSNHLYGDIQLIDPEASSTSEMVLDMALDLRLLVPPTAAECLYVGIITDTGRFCHANTTRSAFRAAARLVALGASPERVGLEVYKSQSFPVLRLQTLAMGTIRLEAGGRIAVMEITPEMFEATGTGAIDTQNFIDIPAGIRGVEVAIQLRREPDSERTKVSLRSKSRVDVSRLAADFGGGGHARAAGFDAPEGIDQLRGRVLEAVTRALADEG
jgi:phosphoesterase RecJ-like protein